MIDRVGFRDKALAIRAKFNRILEDTLADYKGHYIADLNRVMADPAYFHGSVVNKPGAMCFWSEINNLVYKVDMHGNSLRPIKSSDQ